MVLRQHQEAVQQDDQGHIDQEILQPHADDVLGNPHQIGHNQPNIAGGVVADLGELPPLPDVPPVSVHYREEQDFEWGPGRDGTLQTGGPGGRNCLLTPLLNKVPIWKIFWLHIRGVETKTDKTSIVFQVTAILNFPVVGSVARILQQRKLPNPVWSR
jgi:hypothetical protein